MEFEKTAIQEVIAGKIQIEPSTKPRMTRSDKWKKRKCVMKYRAFCDELILKLPNINFDVGVIDLIFHIKMTKSWSKKKKAELNGKWHRQTPDSDNFLKAFADAILKDDSGVYDMRSRKRWTDQESSIEYVIKEYKEL